MILMTAIIRLGMHVPKGIRIEPLGEAAFLLRNFGDVPTDVLSDALSAVPKIQEAAPAYDTVGVYTNGELLEHELKGILESLSFGEAPQSKLHLIPVCYQLGLDLEVTAALLKLSPNGLIELHAGQPYRCFAVGFSPGFPFLGYLPEALQGVSRRPSPRPRVLIGSVGITGRQTGVYPSETPGGWALIGRTPLCLVDLDDAYFPIQAGDEVRFFPISEAEFETRQGERL
jgi:KipI family sensor histidine kinase inhibitor